MKIELKNIKVAHSLSEETNAYTATVYVDGQRAFEASNHGTGGCDDFRPLPGYTGPSEAEINAWLKANKEPLKSDGFTLEYDLELLCGDLVDAHIKEQDVKRIRSTFNRMLRDQLVAIDGQRVVSFGKKFPPTPANVEKLRAQKPTYVIVNGSDDATQARALSLYCPDLAA
jgi:hypothetical protein